MSSKDFKVVIERPDKKAEIVAPDSACVQDEWVTCRWSNGRHEMYPRERVYCVQWRESDDE